MWHIDAVGAGGVHIIRYGALGLPEQQ